MGLSIFLIMMFGITCSPLFVRSDMSLSQVLKSRGIKIPVQVIAEYITYLIMMLVCILILETIAVVAIDKSGLEVTEWSLHFVEDYEYFIIGLIPVVAMFSAMQYMIFLITDNFISGVLLQFIVAVCLGYLGGCLYPIAFFPEIIRKTAVFQPAGLAYRYMSDIMLINDSGLHLCMMLVYVLVFLGLSCLIFARRNASEK